MQRTELPTKEAAIIARLDILDERPLTPEAAEGFLAVGFSQADKDRMNVLAAKARAGTLTPDEHAEAEAYSRISSLLPSGPIRKGRRMQNPADLAGFSIAEGSSRQNPMAMSAMSLKAVLVEMATGTLAPRVADCGTTTLIWFSPT